LLNAMKATAAATTLAAEATAAATAATVSVLVVAGGEAFAWVAPHVVSISNCTSMGL